MAKVSILYRNSVSNRKNSAKTHHRGNCYLIFNYFLILTSTAALPFFSLCQHSLAHCFWKKRHKKTLLSLLLLSLPFIYPFCCCVTSHLKNVCQNWQFHCRVVPLGKTFIAYLGINKQLRRDGGGGEERNCRKTHSVGRIGRGSEDEGEKGKSRGEKGGRGRRGGRKRRRGGGGGGGGKVGIRQEGKRRTRRRKIGVRRREEKEGKRNWRERR